MSDSTKFEHILGNMSCSHENLAESSESYSDIDIDQTLSDPTVIPIDTGPPAHLSESPSRTGSNIFAKIPRKPLSRKVISRGIYECSRLSRVYDLDLNDPVISKISRGGMVYCTFRDGKLYICFGRDRFSRDLTDFGGRRRAHETPIQCAVREGNEESRFAFGALTPEDVQWFWCLYNSRMLIIFVHVAAIVNEDIFRLTDEHFTLGDMIPRQYIHVKNGMIIVSRCCNEISEIVWLGESKIDDVLSDSSRTKVYGCVRRFIRSCPEFEQSAAVIREKLLQICDPVLEREFIPRETGSFEFSRM